MNETCISVSFGRVLKNDQPRIPESTNPHPAQGGPVITTPGKHIYKDIY